MNVWTLAFALFSTSSLVFILVTLVLSLVKKKIALKSLYATLTLISLTIISLAGENDIFLVIFLLCLFVTIVLFITAIVFLIQKHPKTKQAWIGVGASTFAAICAIFLSISVNPQPVTHESTNASSKESVPPKKEAPSIKKITDEETKKEQETKQKEAKKRIEKEKEKERQKAEEREQKKHALDEKKKAEEQAKKEAEEKIAKEKKEQEKREVEEKKKKDLAKKEEEKKKQEESQKEKSTQSPKPSTKDDSLHVNYVTFDVMWSLAVEELGSPYIYEYQNETWMDNKTLFTADFTDDLSIQYKINNEKEVSSIILSSTIPKSQDERRFKEFYDACFTLTLVTNTDSTEKQRAKKLKQLFSTKGKLKDLSKVNTSFSLNGVTYVLKTSSEFPDTLYFGVINSKALK